MQLKLELELKSAELARKEEETARQAESVLAMQAQIAREKLVNHLEEEVLGSTLRARAALKRAYSPEYRGQEGHYDNDYHRYVSL